MKSVVAIVTVLAMVVGFAISVGAVGQININTASKEELMLLEGVGSTYAQNIIEHREANGPFESPENIMDVKGIGEATYEKNKERITVDTQETD
jgi:competence protein ComEA